MKTGQQLPLLASLTILVCISTSCMRQEGSAEVTVDTLETDFFDDLKSANALKTYTGILPCMDCEGIYTELTIHEDSLTYRLGEKYLGDSTRTDTVFSQGTFVRNTFSSGLPRLQLNDSAKSARISFEASGDTMLYKLLPDGESRMEGLQTTLRRK